MIKPGRAPDYRDREYARREREREPEPRKGSAPIARQEPAKTMFEKFERIMQESFRSLCEAVAEIKTKHYYRQVGYDTFEDCCEQRWGISRSKGYRLADANATLKSLKSVPTLATKISNENQARALSEVPKAERVKVLKEVVESGPVTASAIRETAGAQRMRKAEPIVIDVEPEKPVRKACSHCGGTGFEQE